MKKKIIIILAGVILLIIVALLVLLIINQNKIYESKFKDVEYYKFLAEYTNSIKNHSTMTRGGVTSSKVEEKIFSIDLKNDNSLYAKLEDGKVISLTYMLKKDVNDEEIKKYMKALLSVIIENQNDKTINRIVTTLIDEKGINYEGETFNSFTDGDVKYTRLIDEVTTTIFVEKIATK